MSIRELQARKLEALREYHRVCAECDAKIEAIRKQRGQKIKEPDWSGYRETGRDYIPRTPYGDY